MILTLAAALCSAEKELFRALHWVLSREYSCNAIIPAQHCRPDPVCLAQTALHFGQRVVWDAKEVLIYVPLCHLYK